jgi:hypothetical protein
LWWQLDQGAAKEKRREEQRKATLKEHTLLQQHHAGEAILEIPKIHAADAALEVQLAVDIEGLVGADLHLAHALARQLRVRRRRLELVAPGAAPAVAIPIVIAQEVVAAGLLAAGDLERGVDGGEQVLRQWGDERAERVKVGGCVFGIEAAEEIADGKSIAAVDAGWWEKTVAVGWAGRSDLQGTVEWVGHLGS